MSNIVNLPPNRESGLYQAPSHEDGGVQVIVDGVNKVEVEGGEIHLCKSALESDKKHEFNGMTTKEILDDIFQYSNCVFEQGKAKSGDFIICKLVVDDKKKRDITGTTKEIINKFQEEKSCNVTEDVATRHNRQGGTLDNIDVKAEEEAKIRLDILKRMQRRTPNKKTADKIRQLSKDIRNGVYKNMKIKNVVEHYTPELIAIHNLDYGNLFFADKMGGISMPSVAIVNVERPIINFGNITLVLPKDFIDPEKNTDSRVFNRDIYSPTYPSLYSHVDKSSLNRLENELNKEIGNFDQSVYNYLYSDLHSLIEKIKNGSHLPDVLEYADSNKFIIFIWANKNGLPIEIKYTKRESSYWISEADDYSDVLQMIQERYPLLNSAVRTEVYDFQDDSFKKELGDAFRENWIKNKVYNETDKDFAEAKREILEDYFEDGFLKYNVDYNIFKSLILSLKQSKVIDTDLLRDEIKKVGIENSNAIHDFSKKMIERVMSGSYFFKNKTSKVETSLDNIYDFMSSKAIKSSEKNMVYGLGKAASVSAKEYGSLMAVARDREHYTVSKKEFEAYKENQDEAWNKVTDKVRQYHNSSVGFSFDALDDLSKAIGNISKYKDPSDEKISQILAKNNYSKTPSYVYDVIRDFSELLRNAPAEYFEVKIQSIVALESFVGAAIPEGSNHEVIELLNKHGITNVVKYDSNDYENKINNLSEALSEIVKKSTDKILFEKGGEINS